MPADLLRWRLNILSLSEDEAKASGINLPRTRMIFILASTVITVSSTVTVEMVDPDQGAATQQAISRRLEKLINEHWRERDIGDQIRIAQVWQTVRDTPNVRLVRSILLIDNAEYSGKHTE